ncbi:hypothetical protein SLS62_003516 [Diatrype stigma]|uniref:GED domain-containing protein n=1 Tax=Diatrype stigma TaxID=117547 RepID=A0AAN9UV13_9PEZI
MPRRRPTPHVKQEAVDLDHRENSPTPTQTQMKPPATAASEMLDTRTAAASFYRSGAPSADTFQPSISRDHGETPVLMQTRIRREGSQVSSPVSQNPDLKACNDTLGNLQQMGIQHVATLPELVLVGDQSAGKSSQDYEFQPRGRIKVTDVTDRNPFPPWVKKTNRDSKIFKTIYDPVEIEDVLRWAQIAILNPTRNHELYVPNEGNIAKETELTEAATETDAQFSPNIVALEMKGPDLPDLSFYDLPGVFLSPDREENDYLVKVVKNLTRSYIRRPEAIIMWALPMNHDLENSISLGIIREARATDRTIGVITKADMLQEGNISQWLAVLQGKKQSVKHGYFLTSLPPGEAIENAANREENFFRGGVSTWPNEFSEYEDQCGIERLREYITKQLGIAFSRSLPSIKIEVGAFLKDVQHQLLALPEVPTNVEHEVRICMLEFYRHIKTAIRESAFVSRWDKLNSQFQSCIFKIKPTCIVREPMPAPIAQTPVVIDIESDADTVASQTPKRPRPSDSTVRATPTKRPRADVVAGRVKHEDSFVSPLRQPSFTGTPVPSEPTPFAQFYNLNRSAMDIREIRKEIMENRRAGMPRNLFQTEVYEAMALRAIKKWEAPLELYMQMTMKLLTELVNSVLEKSLERFRQRTIFKKSHAALKKFLLAHEQQLRGRLLDRFYDETYAMFTTNMDVLERFRTEEAEALQRARNFARLKAAGLIDFNYFSVPIDKMSAEDKKKERQMLNDLLPRLGEDPFKVELQVASEVRGYYMTSATYFIEGIAKDVYRRLFASFKGGELDMYLDQELGLFPTPTAATFESLMKEDDHIASKREQLRSTRDKLEFAIASIQRLENENNSCADDDMAETSSTHMSSTHTIDLDTVEEEDDLMGEDGIA